MLYGILLMAKLDERDLISMRIILRKLINKHRFGGIHIEITQLRKKGLTKNAEKYLVNKQILLKKKSKGNDEYSINSHSMPLVQKILDSGSVSELPDVN